MNDHAYPPHRTLGERDLDFTQKSAQENRKPVDKSRQNTGFAVRRFALEKALAHCSDLDAAVVIEAAQMFYAFLVPPIEIAPPPQIGLDLGNSETEVMALRITASADPRGPVAFSPRGPQTQDSGKAEPEDSASEAGERLDKTAQSDHPAALKIPKVRPGSLKSRILVHVTAAGAKGISCAALAEAMDAVDITTLSATLTVLKREGLIAHAPRKVRHPTRDMFVNAYVLPEFCGPAPEGTTESESDPEEEITPPVDDEAPLNDATSPPGQAVWMGPREIMQKVWSFPIQTKPIDAETPAENSPAKGSPGLFDAYGRFAHPIAENLHKVLIRRAVGQKVQSDIGALKRECSLSDGKVREIVSALERAGYVEWQDGFIVPLRNLRGDAIDDLPGRDAR